MCDSDLEYLPSICDASCSIPNSTFKNTKYNCYTKLTLRIFQNVLLWSDGSIGARWEERGISCILRAGIHCGIQTMEADVCTLRSHQASTCLFSQLLLFFLGQYSNEKYCTQLK